MKPCHPNPSPLHWPEFPYKQNQLDKIQTKFKQITLESAAGGLLAGRGNEKDACFEIQQHGSIYEDEQEGWKLLAERFYKERGIFHEEKKKFILQLKQQTIQTLATLERKKKLQQEVHEFEEWKKKQITIRYENGSKYDGDGINQNHVLIPHGKGTLWVPEKEVQGTDIGGIKRIQKYTGMWMDGMMHGHGTYWWKNGDSWEGNFIRNELHGKGSFTPAPDPSDMNSSSHPGLPAGSRPSSGTNSNARQRVRYFNASQHVCWGEELVEGCRLRLYGKRHFADPLVSVIKRYDVDIEEEIECVIIMHDLTADKYLIRIGETENTKWVSLDNCNFRIIKCPPIARLRVEERK
jgi:hypothetical protein